MLHLPSQCLVWAGWGAFSKFLKGTLWASDGPVPEKGVGLYCSSEVLIELLWAEATEAVLFGKFPGDSDFPPGLGTTDWWSLKACVTLIGDFEFCVSQIPSFLVFQA